MIALWMLYASAVGVLAAGAAALAERVARAVHRPTRVVWAVALALALVVPGTALVRPPAAATAVVVAPGTSVAPAAAVVAARPPAAAPEPRRAPERPAHVAPSPTWRATETLASLDRPLLALWGAASLAIAVAFITSSTLLAGRRRRWQATRVAGVDVLVARDVGPAVVGVLRPRVVLPSWAVAVDESDRALIVAHEREHVAAGDPRTLALGMLAVALCPWNVALWYAWRRLRLAVELDCDARVLAARPDVERYGRLLLDVGRRAARGPLVAAALAEGGSHLERRIVAMTERTDRPYRARAALSLGGAAALLAAACVAPHPARVAAPRPLASVAPDSALYDSLRTRFDAMRAAGSDSSGNGVNAELYAQLRRMVDSSWIPMPTSGPNVVHDLLLRRSAELDSTLYELLRRRADSVSALKRDSAELYHQLVRASQSLHFDPSTRTVQTPAEMVGMSQPGDPGDSAVAANGGCAADPSPSGARQLVVLVPASSSGGTIDLRSDDVAGARAAGRGDAASGAVVLRSSSGDELRCSLAAGPYRVRVSADFFRQPGARLLLVGDQSAEVVVRRPDGRMVVGPFVFGGEADSLRISWQAGGRSGGLASYGPKPVPDLSEPRSAIMLRAVRSAVGQPPRSIVVVPGRLDLEFDEANSAGIDRKHMEVPLAAARAAWTIADRRVPIDTVGVSYTTARDGVTVHRQTYLFYPEQLRESGGH